LIEEYLKKHSAKSAANNRDIFEAMKGEVVKATLFIESYQIPQRSIDHTIIFESATSFVFSSNGSYWINDKSTTKELLEKELRNTKGVHDQYHIIHDLLELPRPQ